MMKNSGFAEATKTQFVTGLFLSFVAAWIVMATTHESLHWFFGFPDVREICLLGFSNGKVAWISLVWRGDARTPWWIDGYTAGLPFPISTLIHFVGCFLLTMLFMYLLMGTHPLRRTVEVASKQEEN